MEEKSKGKALQEELAFTQPHIADERPALTEAAANVIRGAFGPQAVAAIGPQMPGEDFCHFHEKCPGFFVEVGAASEEKGITAPHHNPHYQLDEDALPLAVEYVTNLLRSRLKR